LLFFPVVEELGFVGVGLFESRSVGALVRENIPALGVFDEVDGVAQVVEFTNNQTVFGLMTRSQSCLNNKLMQSYFLIQCGAYMCM